MAANRNKELGGMKRKRKERPVVEDIPEPKKMQLGTGESKFARALGSTDYQTREKGLTALGRWMSSKASMADSDLLKLWKGIFYCFWHSDKAPVQDDLAKRLSELLLQLEPKVASVYFRTFFLTIRREWLGIDRLRLDKFLLLIRYFLRQMLTMLQKSKWDKELVDSYMKSLLEGCLMPKDTCPAAGVAYHIADIYIGEICTVTEDSHAKPKVLRALLEPFCVTLSTASSQALLNRIRDAVFVEVAEHCESGEGALAGLDCEALAEELFEAAASGATSQKNRAVLYELNKRLAKALKRRAVAKKSPEDQDTSAAEEAPTYTPKQAKEPKSKLKERKPKKGKFVAMGDIIDSEASTQAAKANVSEATPTVKKVKKSKKEESPTPAASSVAAANGTNATPAVKKVKKSKKEEPPTSAPFSVAAADETDTTPTVKKVKKSKTEKTPTPAASSAEKTAKEPQSGEANGQQQAHAGRHNAAEALTPPKAKLPPVTPGTTGKKSVKFSMRNNLYFAFGGPVPEADVRTPQSAKPKGPALKKISAFGGSQTPHRFGKKSGKTLTPRSAPRPSAADFF